jgi:signal transduction histidine kinase
VLFWIVANSVRWGGSAGFPFSGGVVVLFACAAAAGTVAVIIRRIATPVADIVSASDGIARRNYRVRVAVPDRGPAWVSETARAFNAMAGQLEAQDEARRHLMADIAHELRTPLAVLQGKLEGLVDGVYPRDTGQLQGLLEDTRVLARLVEDLRTLSTSESGALALSKEPTDFVALANDVASSLKARAEESGVTLAVGADPTDATRPIDVDPVRMREVLMNLVANALRYTPRGGRVTITVTDREKDVEITIADNGAGIAEADLPHIFDRFYKGAGSSGSGLGLTIARNLIEAHGGTIRARSERGAGTTMAVSLPR